MAAPTTNSHFILCTLSLGLNLGGGVEEFMVLNLFMHIRISQDLAFQTQWLPLPTLSSSFAHYALILWDVLTNLCLNIFFGSLMAPHSSATLLLLIALTTFNFVIKIKSCIFGVVGQSYKKNQKEKDKMI